MFIKIGDTSLNVAAFRDWKYDTFVAVYRGVLKGNTAEAWAQIQSNLPLLQNEHKEEVKEIKQETLFNTDADVQKTDKPRRKRKRNTP